MAGKNYFHVDEQWSAPNNAIGTSSSLQRRRTPRPFESARWDAHRPLPPTACVRAQEGVQGQLLDLWPTVHAAFCALAALPAKEQLECNKQGNELLRCAEVLARSDPDHALGFLRPGRPLGAVLFCAVQDRIAMGGGCPYGTNSGEGRGEVFTVHIRFVHVWVVWAPQGDAPRVSFISLIVFSFLPSRGCAVG